MFMPMLYRLCVVNSEYNFWVASSRVLHQRTPFFQLFNSSGSQFLEEKKKLWRIWMKLIYYLVCKLHGLLEGLKPTNIY